MALIWERNGKAKEGDYNSKDPLWFLNRAGISVWVGFLDQLI